MPSASSCFETLSTVAASPDNTTVSAPLITPIATSFSSPAIAFCTRSAVAAIDRIAPASVNLSISRARAHTRRMPSSTLNTPAITAATYSPRLCPSTTLGSIPQLRHNSASEYSNANNDGCAYRARFIRLSACSTSSLGGYSTSISDSPVSSFQAAAHRSIAARNTAELSYSSRPIPTYWLPCPVNRKHIPPPSDTGAVAPSKAASCCFNCSASVARKHAR